MNKEIKSKLDYLKSNLKTVSYYNNAIAVLGFDLETICPRDAKEDEGDTLSFLDNEVFKIKNSKEFISSFEYLFQHIDELDDEYDAYLVKNLHRRYNFIKNVTPELNLEISKLYNKSGRDWLEAKQKQDYSIFKPTLEKVRDMQLKLYEISKLDYATPYDFLLDQMEPGLTTKDLDEFFNKLKKGTLEILDKIKKSNVVIKDDFMSKEVEVYDQAQFNDVIMHLIGFDTNKGMLGTTEHPFTNTLNRNDARITTKYIKDSFISNIFTVIHEGGHAIFFQNQNPKDYEYFIDNCMTDSMHESVSRFYENRIARSKPFIHVLYPMLAKAFPHVLQGVSEEELYKAINKVTPSLIRTEADELTYSLHIIIRYELEKEIINNKLDLADLPEAWNKKYKEYLGVNVKNDTEGVLQDIHWTTGFAYFPAYALGNAMNAMYYNVMDKEIDIEKAILNKDFTTINNWMKEHVFKKSNILSVKEWLKDIANKQLDPSDYLKYLDEKYKDIYQY